MQSRKRLVHVVYAVVLHVVCESAQGGADRAGIPKYEPSCFSCSRKTAVHYSYHLPELWPRILVLPIALGEFWWDHVSFGPLVLALNELIGLLFAFDLFALHRFIKIGAA